MIIASDRTVNYVASDAPRPDAWSEAPLRELIEHLLERDHLWLRIRMPEIETGLAEMVTGDGGRHAAVLAPLRRVFQHFRQDAETHMHKEETVLFPAILKLEASRESGAPVPRWPFGSLSNPVRLMRQDHDKSGLSLDEMRQITGNYTLPSDAPATWRRVYEQLAVLEADVREHMRLENSVLFPRAVEMENDLGRGIRAE